MAKQGRREQELSKHNGGGGGAAMPAPAHRNCRLPGKTRAATQLGQLRDTKGRDTNCRDTSWRDQPKHQGYLADTRDGIGRKQGTKPTRIFKQERYLLKSVAPKFFHPTKKRSHISQSHLRDLSSGVFS